MRLASYNVQNVARRARVLSLESWNDSKPILEAQAELSALMARETYDDAARRRMKQLLVDLGLEKSRRSRFVTLVEQRGELAGVSALRGLRVTARGRGDWVGWLEFETDALPQRATMTLGQVVRDLDADVVVAQEVESRLALATLGRHLVPAVGGKAYHEVFHAAGNDDRGLGLGVAVRQGYTIGWTRSHADDRDGDGRPIFDRDAPEVSVWTPAGNVLWVIPLHLRSRGYGRKEDADARRLLQVKAVADAYRRLVGEGARYIAVCGDLNDTPDSDAFSMLLKETNLADVSSSPVFRSDGLVGTFGKGTAKEKIDYILLSPDLMERIKGAGVIRKGAWGPQKVPPWEVYAEVKSRYDAASDHAALWCELDV